MKKVLSIAIIVFILGTSHTALALPSLQVYMPGAVADTRDEDEQTWFQYYHHSPTTYNLIVVGCYQPNDTSITDAVLLATVYEGESGSIGGLGTGTRYDDVSFSPANLVGWPLNKPRIFDYIAFNIGSFGKVTTGLKDYNAQTGIIKDAPNEVGEEKQFSISISGYEFVHFDAYAKFNGDDNDWRVNPGSHDSTGHHTPEPATILLFGLGALGFGVLRRR